MTLRIALALSSVTVLAACSANKDAANTSTSTSSSSGAATELRLVANSALRSDVTKYAPAVLGGLVGQLIVQPRATMIAQDTVTVGCGQSGSGALGIDAYLADRSWVNQNILLTDLFVPARNFRLGFPSVAVNGAMVAVQSYFVIDAQGFFRLDPNDTEGDYQFSLAADDGARLKLNNVMVVDDQKPAGPNGGCLEQTQASHLSCTSNWSSQTAANVVTVHIKPGDLVPMSFQYWEGPGNGIGMMGFYRKVTASKIDPICGTEPDFSQNGAGLAAVLKTWKPIQFANLSNASNM